MEHLQQQLDSLLAQSQDSPKHLKSLVAKFAELVADRMDIANDYESRIEEVCNKWKEDYPLAEGLIHMINALAQYYRTHFGKVENSVSTAIENFLKNKELDLYGLSCMILGASKRSLGEMDEAVEYLMNGAENINPHGDYGVYCCYSYYQLAEINLYFKDYEAARLAYEKTAEMANRIDEITPLFRAYNGLGNLYLAEGNFEKSHEYLDKSMSIADSPSQESRTLCDIGILCLEENDLKSAVEALHKSFLIRQESGFEDASSTSLIHLGEAYWKLEQHLLAEERLNEALSICKKFNSKAKMMKCYDLLWRVYDDWDKPEDSIKSFKAFNKLNTELTSVKMQNMYKLKNRKINEQKEAIETIHNKVQSSIRYAQRIQNAILPPESLFEEWLPGSFIYYEPKDIVAGDFYWLEKSGDNILFAAADCTGHGVPGALVSVLCHNSLNRAVREFNLKDPGQILNKTRELVKKAFDRSEEVVQDGMDIALCSINENQLKFAGAYNPLLILRGEEEIILKANRQPVGKFEIEKPFETREFELQSGDRLFIYSDGFADQFGGEELKKMGSRMFRELLAKLDLSNPKESCDSLAQSFEDWKGEEEQLDDVCVIGYLHK